jgi:hypothetical protein
MPSYCHSDMARECRTQGYCNQYLFTSLLCSWTLLSVVMIPTSMVRVSVEFQSVAHSLLRDLVPESLSMAMVSSAT